MSRSTWTTPFKPFSNLTFVIFSLVSGDVLSNLIDLIIHEPPEDLEPAQRFKCAHVAAELLSCEVPQVTDNWQPDKVLESFKKLFS